MSIKKIIRETLSEPGPNGTLSWGRVASSLSLLSCIVWVSRVVFKTHAIPDLSGVSAFGVAPYAANKVGAAVQSFSDNPVSVVVPPILPTK